MSKPNPFDDSYIVNNYEAWYRTVGRRADRQEKYLLKGLLTNFPAAHSILEVGCGTGHFVRWLDNQGFRLIGLDISWQMLLEAKSLSALRYLQGDAQALPFRSGSFDLVVMITTLEFLIDPPCAMTEAARVAQQGFILGVINARSRLGRRYKREAGPIWKAARFTSLDELLLMTRNICGDKVNITWRTTLWSLWPGTLPYPWGGFIGMAVQLS